MNILIFGPAASGKTLLMQLLAQHFKWKGEAVAMYEDENYSFSRKDHKEACEKIESILKNTKGEPKKHTIVATQSPPSAIFGFYDTAERDHLYDFYYQTYRDIKGVRLNERSK